jgi:hypothetical protein
MTFAPQLAGSSPLLEVFRQETRDMTNVIAGEDPLKRLFAALTEHTFQVDLGVADPPLIDYLSDLLVRFSRVDVIFGIRNAVGRRLEEVADMLLEAQQREERPKREIHRHIGDFTMFWVGVYPEALGRLQSGMKKDSLLDYCEQGKRSYYIASTFEDGEYRDQAPVLRRLADEFELCTVGLNRVRREWQRLPSEPHGDLPAAG